MNDESPTWSALRTAAGIEGSLQGDAIEGPDAESLRDLARRAPSRATPWQSTWTALPSGHGLLAPELPRFRGIPPEHLPAPWPRLDDAPMVWCVQEHPDGEATDLEILMLEPESHAGSWQLVRLHSWLLEDVDRPHLQANGGWQALLLVHRGRPVASTGWAYLVWGSFETWFGPDLPVLVIEESMGGTANPGALTEIWTVHEHDAVLIAESSKEGSVRTMVEETTVPPSLTHHVWLYEGCGANDLSVVATRAIDPRGMALQGVPPTTPVMSRPSTGEIERLSGRLGGCLEQFEPASVPLCRCSEPISTLLQWCFDGHPEAAWTAIRSLETTGAWQEPLGTALQELLDASGMYRELPWVDVRWETR